MHPTGVGRLFETWSVPPVITLCRDSLEQRWWKQCGRQWSAQWRSHRIARGRNKLLLWLQYLRNNSVHAHIWWLGTFLDQHLSIFSYDQSLLFSYKFWYVHVRLQLPIDKLFFHKNCESMLCQTVYKKSYFK